MTPITDEEFEQAWADVDAEVRRMVRNSIRPAERFALRARVSGGAIPQSDFNRACWAVYGTGRTKSDK